VGNYAPVGVCGQQISQGQAMTQGQQVQLGVPQMQPMPLSQTLYGLADGVGNYAPVGVCGQQISQGQAMTQGQQVQPGVPQVQPLPCSQPVPCGQPMPLGVPQMQSRPQSQPIPQMVASDAVGNSGGLGSGGIQPPKMGADGEEEVKSASEGGDMVIWQRGHPPQEVAKETRPQLVEQVWFGLSAKKKQEWRESSPPGWLMSKGKPLPALYPPSKNALFEGKFAVEVNGVTRMTKHCDMCHVRKFEVDFSHPGMLNRRGPLQHLICDGCLDDLMCSGCRMCMPPREFSLNQMLKLRPEKVDPGSGEVVQRGRRCNRCLEKEAAEAQQAVAVRRAEQEVICLTTEEQAAVEEEEPPHETEAHQPEEGVEWKEKPQRSQAQEREARRQEAAAEAKRQMDELGCPAVVEKRGVGVLFDNKGAIEQARRTVVEKDAFFGGQQGPLPVDPGPSPEEIAAEEEEKKAAQTEEQEAEECRLRGLVAGAEVMVTGVPEGGLVQDVQVTAESANGEVMEDELAPGITVRVVETWTGDEADGVLITGAESNAGLLVNASGAEAPGPWTVGVAHVAMLMGGSVCSLAIRESQDYSSSIKLCDPRSTWYQQPVFEGMRIWYGEDDPDEAEGVWLPVLKWHPEVEPDQEVLGYLNADSTREFQVLAVIGEWALIADADPELVDKTLPIEEDPYHLDYQPGLWEFDYQLDMEVTRHSGYDWHGDFDEEPRFKTWVEDGMGIHGPRLHTEMKGCVIRMLTEGGGYWKPVRRMFVWMSTQFLMPINR